MVKLLGKHHLLASAQHLEGRHNSKVYVNDINTDTAPSYTIFNLRAGFEQNLAHWQFKEYVRIENMFDKEYIGSVSVNDGNALFFEPGADRNYLVGLSAQNTSFKQSNKLKASCTMLAFLCMVVCDWISDLITAFSV